MFSAVKPLLAFACVILFTAAASAETHVIEVNSKSRMYSPNRLHVFPGDEIEFRNVGQNAETVTLKGFPEILDAQIDPGGTHTLKFEDSFQPGRYHFYSPSESMYKGILLVNPTR